MNSYHIVSLHLKIVHYWIFCICMHLDHAYHVIFQIKIIWIWKMFIHICGMFDLQLTNASRIKHLFNKFYRFIFLEMIFNSCMDIIWFICHIQKKSSLVFCVHLVLQFTRETCILYFLFLFGIYIYNCYSLRLSGPMIGNKIRTLSYQTPITRGTCSRSLNLPDWFFFTVNVLPTFTIFKWVIHWR
jgi:hypothetical protein